MTQALFAPTAASPSRERARRGTRWLGLTLFWRLLGVNLVVVLGGALVGTWLTQRLVLSGSFTPITHAILVLAAVCLSAGVSVLLLRRQVDDLWDRLEADAATIREKTEQAERLAAQVILAQEEERRRVARELHDEAGQALTAVIIGLERGLASMPETYASDLPIQPRQLISNLRDLAAQTLDEVRKLALELRPSVLDDLGLVAALRQYVRSTEERSGLVAQLTVVGWEDADQRLPAEVETALFRIAQEALTNAIRHARASSVQVRLRRAADAVTLEVRDDGVGLSAVPMGQAGEHLGMFGMRERARLLGGEFHASPASPRGTLVHARIPLAA
jgi:two-component system, NarL family, sensor histidine kinase UhpB